MFRLDRLYGELHFPSLVSDTLDCPGLLRLREVRMANIPFLSFPSFTGVTRYEHSLGVCHLAGIFADKVGLCDKDRIEVMLAALYHDVATPPFGHAVEEVLSDLHGFDHEEKLREIIIGKAKDLGGQRTQLFLGRSLKLHKVCQSTHARALGVDVLRIADIAAGSLNDTLGDVVCSSGIDLDNIDNVIRAATSMGVREYGPAVAENLARSLVIDEGRVCIDESFSTYLKSWESARSILYGMIYASIKDFSLQTMLKHALRILANVPAENQLRETDWNLTDDELIHQRLLLNRSTHDIVIRMRLADLYNCLSFLLIEPKDVSVKTAPSLYAIERQAQDIFRRYIERVLKPKRTDFDLPEIIANMYPDKRIRSAGRPVCFMGQKFITKQELQPKRWILGVFTPHHRKWDQEAEIALYDYLSVNYHVQRLRCVRIGEGRYPNVEEDQK